MDNLLSWTERNFRFVMWNLGWLLVSILASMATKNPSWMMMFVIAMAFSFIARAGWLPIIARNAPVIGGKLWSVALLPFGKWLWSVAKDLFTWAMDNKVLAWIIISIIVAAVSMLRGDWPTFWLSFLSMIVGFITYFDGWGSLGKFMKEKTKEYPKSTFFTVGVAMFIIGSMFGGGMGMLIGITGGVFAFSFGLAGFASFVKDRSDASKDTPESRQLKHAKAMAEIDKEIKKVQAEMDKLKGEFELKKAEKRIDELKKTSKILKEAVAAGASQDAINQILKKAFGSSGGNQKKK